MPETEDIDIPAGDAVGLRAALALPADRSRPLAAIVVIHEILGLNDDIRRIAGRFAQEGYVALAPDLYTGTSPKPLCVLRTLAALRAGRGKAWSDLDAALGYLSAMPEVDPARIGVAGFCMGGGFALLYACRGTVGAAATFYGEVPTRADDLHGVCPVVAGYGARDRIFADQGRRLERLLEEMGVDHDVVVYGGVGHSYMSHQDRGVLAFLGGISPMRVGYDEAAAEDSWRRMLAFFERHLG
jgi:carboxymethylenebutenolidase